MAPENNNDTTIPPGTQVLVHGIQNPTNQWLNDELLFVKNYDPECQRYVCTREDDLSDAVGLFRLANLTILEGEDYEKYCREEKKKKATLYDPNGPHPEKLEGDMSAMFPILRVLCPNVQRYSLEDKCRACGTKPAKEKLKFCSRCKGVSYCSKACEKVHWKTTHKRECTTRQERIRLLQQNS
jgi:rRNA maturation protein Nop10